MEQSRMYLQGFIPYALAAFLIGIVGGFSTVVAPAFVQDIGIAYNHTTWTALAQAMSTAACAPILGKLGDVFGRKRTLLWGMVVFTLGNVLTASASHLPFMLVARFVVGIGTAAIAPVVMAYIVTEFPQNAVAKGFSLYMLISSISVVFGPTLGGMLIAKWGWRVMCWICVAICIGVFIPCMLTGAKEQTERKPLKDFDKFGAVMVLVFFSLLLCVPAFGQNFGWSSAAFWSIAIAALFALAGLIMAERNAVNPILPWSFINRKPLVLSVLALFLTQGLMQANMTNTIVFVNYTQPENSMISGYAISVMYLGMSLGSVILGPLADRYEPRSVLTGSLTLTGVSCAMMLLFSANSSALLLMAALGILGFGLGGNGAILMKVALSGLPPERAGAGTGTYGLFRDLAAPFGVAVFVPMFTNQITRQLSAGMGEAEAAVDAIHTLAAVEMICVAIGIGVVLLLPRIHQRKGE